jgi:(2R)-3-sulfolactate dehydrogenase (NADP+)
MKVPTSNAANPWTAWDGNGNSHTTNHKRQTMTTLTLEAARGLVAAALERAGASTSMAASTARALVLAEAQGLSSHGLARVAQYAAHLRNGRVDGQAVPRLQTARGGAAVVDAQDGLAFPACDLAVAEAIQRARDFGVAFVGVTRSHHGGVMADHLRPVVEAGLVGLAFANSPSAMPAAGGRHPIFGTNPLAAAFPRRGEQALLVDLSLSEVARGKLMVAAQRGHSIPQGWALDKAGRPTTDPKAGMEGSMLPIGAATSPKGAMLALVVELLVTALIGAHFGFEASSFFVAEGNRPRLGQAFLVIDPGALAGADAYLERVEVLVREMLLDEGVRLPGTRREELLRHAQSQGLEVADALLAALSA